MLNVELGLTKIQHILRPKGNHLLMQDGISIAPEVGTVVNLW